MRWEYRVATLWPRVGEGADRMNDAGDAASLLNALGADGWELSAVAWLNNEAAADGATLTAFMKRPVE